MFCQSATLLENIILSVQDILEDKKYKVYVGEGKDSDYATTGIEKKNELQNVNTCWAQCDLVAFTGTICVGVDFNIEHFDSIFGIYTGDLGLTPDLFVQGLLRARKLKNQHHHLFMSKTPNVNEKNLSVYPLTSQRYYQQTRNTILDQCKKIDIFGHQKTGLRCLLGSRSALMHYYAQDYIIQCLKDLGFSFEMVSGGVLGNGEYQKKEVKEYPGASKEEIKNILRTIERKKSDPMAQWSPAETNVNKLLYLNYGI